MDQIKIGQFIQARRKEKGMTQNDLAALFNISDRAVSKWERGLSLPDASIMIGLSEILGISVNELLSGEKMEKETDYRKSAEENLLELKRKEEESNRYLLRIETVIGVLSTLSFLLLLFTSEFFVSILWIRIALDISAFIIFLVGISFALLIEKDAGYYECAKCHEKYIPTYKAVLLAPHNGRTRWLKCPHCHKRSWHKKVLS